MMAKFRKKPVVIEAVRWQGNNQPAIKSFVGDQARFNPDWDRLQIRTLESGEGYHEADIGDWIIKGVKGEFYPCKPDIFAATYEPVQDAP
jgi:hypothetical protein